MNFEKNKSDLLAQMQKNKSDRKPAKVCPSQAAKIATLSTSTQIKKDIALYGGNKLFVNNVKQMLVFRYVVYQFSNTTDLIDQCAEKCIGTIVIDLDEPTGFKTVLEIYNNLLMVQPQTNFIFCSGKPQADDASYFMNKGEVVLKKPISSDELVKTIENPVKK